jgi:regulator of nucleoside diphosphate kinase
MIITRNDHQRLLELIETPSVKIKMPLLIDKLSSGLRNARLLSQDEIRKNIVTMNSRVKLRDVISGREADITVTYPDEADPGNRRVSVLSEIGVALLGKKEGDVVSWNVPRGVGRFQIVAVVYQPEAAGNFAL